MYQTCWIGLSDSAVEGSYRWESDNSLVNYTHWGTEEPNDAAGVEDCVAVWGGASAGYWNDDYCDSEKYFICEKPGGMFDCFSSMVLEVEQSSTHLPFEFCKRGHSVIYVPIDSGSFCNRLQPNVNVHHLKMKLGYLSFSFTLR